MNSKSLLFALAILSSAASSSAQEPLPPAAQQKVDFKKDVYPLLQEHCFSCHQGTKASSGHRLDLRTDLLGETNGKPLVQLGRSDESRLIHVVAGRVPGKVMPRKGPRLSERQIGLMRAWIDQGLAWDERLLPAAPLSEHWAFQPVRRPSVPEVKQPSRRNPVDAFIFARLDKDGLTANPEADRRVLIRRLYLDLIGLPPPIEEVEAFRKDPAADAYEKLVERLLASPHYGERWARHWLDLARWAESEGYESNHPRAFAWRYRDWVVRSFNRDKPFDAFVREQLAGDEIVPCTDDNIIATGFLAAARLSSNEEDRWRQRNDIFVDMVNATASTLLGLTLQCAQCHNHKFDPLTARDYYRFQGFFVQGQPGNLALKDPALWAAFEAKKPKGYDEALRQRDELFEVGRARRIADVKKSLPAQTLRALDLPMKKRSHDQEKMVRLADLQLQFTANQIEKNIPAQDRQRYDELKKKVAEMEKTMVEKPQTFGFYSPITSPNRLDVLPMKGFYPLLHNPAELALARPYLLVAGDVHRPSFALDAGWPAVFGSATSPPRTRLALAEWVTSPSNPLTARVFVNRLWQHHFGRGIVATASDFGQKGSPPSHPELLDWLATEFMNGKWSVKHMHRLLVLSHTYRQASAVQSENQRRDPDNQAWWRFEPRRLEAEAIRDVMLAVSGELDTRLGGASGEGKSLRRSLYLFQKRDMPPPQQALFDGPSAMTESCARRQMTTVPLQALYLLNSEFSMERARALARRVSKKGAGRTEQIEAAFRMGLARSPTPAEAELAQRFWQRHPPASETGTGPSATLVQFCQALINVNEFVYLE